MRKYKDSLERNRLDLRYADLHSVDLSGLPFERASLNCSHLEGANLNSAHLEEANLGSAYLRRVYFFMTHLERAFFYEAHLEGANLSEAYLEGAILDSTFFDSTTHLGSIRLSDKWYGDISHVDIHWNDVNLAVVDWSGLTLLGEEGNAQRKRWYDGKPRNREERLYDYNTAARAYRQLAGALRNQGLNEDAARFAYRAQLMQCKAFWYQRKFGQYLGSLFLDLLSGYGYRVGRCFIVYALVIGAFATIYHLLGAHPAWNEAVVISMTAFHGRGLFPDQFHPGDPQALAAAIDIKSR